MNFIKQTFTMEGRYRGQPIICMRMQSVRICCVNLEGQMITACHTREKKH